MSLSTKNQFDVTSREAKRPQVIERELDESHWEQRASDLLDRLKDHDYEDFADDMVIVSTDLSEATYSFSHDLMEVNEELFDKVMEDFPPWQVFNKLFKIKARDVNFSQLNRDGYTEKDSVVSTSGTFMGDPLSFIHLTLVMLSAVDQATVMEFGSQPLKDVYRRFYARRPFGQSVGDDLVALRATRKWASLFRAVLDQLGLKRSKLDSESPDSGTFCENYLVRLAKGQDYGETPEFGDMVFIDCIKGSILSGQAKVKGDGSSPFLGHAKMLQKQISYVPQEAIWKADAAKLLLWCRNYRDCRGLTEALPQLPKIMGGLDLAMGRTPTLDDERLSMSYWPYLYSLAKGDLPQAIVLESLLELQSIWSSSNKGFIWDSLEFDVFSITNNLKIISQEEAWKDIPAYMAEKPPLQKLGWLEKEKGIISLMQLANELERRYNFLKWWKGDIPQASMLRFNPKVAGERHREVWNHLRETIPQSDKPFHITSVKKLESMLTSITFGNYFLRDDPAISQAFQGMPSLFLTY